MGAGPELGVHATHGSDQRNVRHGQSWMSGP